MKKQVFHFSWILFIGLLIFIAMMLLTGFGVLSESKMGFLVCLFWVVLAVVVGRYGFRNITVTKEYIQVGSNTPILWKNIKKIEHFYSRSEFLLIEYVQVYSDKEHSVRKSRKKEARTVLFLTFIHHPKKLLNAIEQYFYITEKR